jgi:UDP-N-acetylmuramate dehydrogenase
MNRNLNSTTARDVLELIEILKAKAKAERGIELHTEVEIIGEEIL